MKITQINNIGELTIHEIINGEYYIIEKNMDPHNGDIKIWPIRIMSLQGFDAVKENVAVVKIEM